MKHIWESRRNRLLLGLAGLICLVFFINTILSAPQCPLEYTQAQVDASSCIVGANIGAGIFFLFLPIVVLILPIVLLAVLVIRHRRKR